MTAMIVAVVKDFGRLDILINNAGLALRQRFVDTRPEDWRRQIDACLYGAIHCCHAAAPQTALRAVWRSTESNFCPKSVLRRLHDWQISTGHLRW